jgi:hypothetical protein
VALAGMPWGRLLVVAGIALWGRGAREMSPLFPGPESFVLLLGVLALLVGLTLHALAGLALALLRGEAGAAGRELVAVAAAVAGLLVATSATLRGFASYLALLSPTHARTPHQRWCAWMFLTALASLGSGLRAGGAAVRAAWNRHGRRAGAAAALAAASLALAAVAADESTSLDPAAPCDGQPCRGG